MQNNFKRLTIGEIKDLDMVDFLSSLGHEPTKVRNNDYWYRSPLRNEKEASFKVNRRMNRWYDHGIGKGGSLIDFGIAYYPCTIGEFLQKFTDGSLFVKPHFHPAVPAEKETRISIIDEADIHSMALIDYLEYRNISLTVAERYCREVRYGLDGKTFFGIGFHNDSGGYEIRNPYFKTSSSPKDITTIDSISDQVNVFEGFMDFLSFKSHFRDGPENSFDAVVLNSLSFFEKARPFMERHTGCNLYLDNDNSGQNCMLHARSLDLKYVDKSMLYGRFKDLNEWHMDNGSRHKQKHRLHL